MQHYTSKNTSINKTRLPRVYNEIPFKAGDTVFDYGCGKYVDHLINHVDGYGAMWDGFDPYNFRSDNAIDLVQDNDVVICSNVLNVIDTDTDVIEVLDSLYLLLDSDGTCYITVYEGDKSGIGRVTKDDCYQRNQPLQWYVDFIKEYSNFTSVTVKKGVIICKVDPLPF
jgi:hypothetical protein